MDLPLPAHSPGQSPGQSHFHAYVQIAMVLAVITGTEILLIFLPFAKWLVIGSLMALSAIKFLLVISYFMHLRWDRVLCAGIFVVGLIIGGGTMLALLSLFGASASLPLSAQP